MLQLLDSGWQGCTTIGFQSSQYHIKELAVFGDNKRFVSHIQVQEMKDKKKLSFIPAPDF